MADFQKQQKHETTDLLSKISKNHHTKKVRFPLNSPFLTVFGPSLGFESLKFASQKWSLFLETKVSFIKFSKNMNFEEKVPEKPNQNVASLTITVKKKYNKKYKSYKTKLSAWSSFLPKYEFSIFFILTSSYCALFAFENSQKATT